MARRKQEIRVQIHICEDAQCPFSKTDLEKFWKDKIEDAVRKSRFTREEVMALFEKEMEIR